MIARGFLPLRKTGIVPDDSFEGLEPIKLQIQTAEEHTRRATEPNFRHRFQTAIADHFVWCVGFCVGYTGKNGNRSTGFISTVEITFVGGVLFKMILSVGLSRLF